MENLSWFDISCSFCIFSGRPPLRFHFFSVHYLLQVHSRTFLHLLRSPRSEMVMKERNLVLRSLRRPVGLHPIPLLLLLLSIFSAVAGSYVIVITKEDLKDPTITSSDGGKPLGDSAEWEEFGDPESQSEDELDPGSWRPIFEASDASSTSNSSTDDSHDSPYLSSIRKMLSAVSSGDMAAMEEAVNDIEAGAAAGFPHAQSALGFFYGAGIMRPPSRTKAFLYHQFAAGGGNMQSKMVLAYTYLRQEVNALF